MERYSVVRVPIGKDNPDVFIDFYMVKDLNGEWVQYQDLAEPTLDVIRYGLHGTGPADRDLYNSVFMEEDKDGEFVRYNDIKFLDIKYIQYLDIMENIRNDKHGYEVPNSDINEKTLLLALEKINSKEKFYIMEYYDKDTCGKDYLYNDGKLFLLKKNDILYRINM